MKSGGETAGDRASRLAGEGRILLAFLVWSTSGPIMREAERLGVGIPSFIVFANLVGAVALLAGRRSAAIGDILKLPRVPLLLFSICFTANTWFFFEAFRHTSLANAFIVHHTAPILVAVLSPSLLREPPPARIWIALVLAMCGVASVTWGGIGGLSGPHVVGIMFAAVSALAYAGLVIIGRKLARDGANPIALVIVPSAFLTVVALPFVDFSDYSPEVMGLAGVAGILHLAVGAALYYSGLRRASAARAGLLGYTEVLFGILWGALFYAESIDFAKAAGAVFIIAGGALGSDYFRKSAAP